MRHNYSALHSRFSDPFEVHRRDPGKVVGGRYQRPEVSEIFPATGSVQPLNTRDIQRLPEGSRTDGAKKIYTECELRVGEVPNPDQDGEELQEADHVIYEGEEYEVSGDDDWSVQAGYYKFFLTKAGQ